MRIKHLWVIFAAQNSLINMYKIQMDKPPFADAEQMLLTAAIDFAIPPSANEKQIEDAITEIMDESSITTMRKVDKLWEEHFHHQPDPNVETKVLKTVDTLKQYGKRYLANPSQPNLRKYEEAAEEIGWHLRAFIRGEQSTQEDPEKPHRQVQDVQITQKQVMDRITDELPKVVESFRKSGGKGPLSSLSDIFQFLPILIESQFGISDEATAFRLIDFIKLQRVARTITKETPDSTTLFNVVKTIFHQDIPPQTPPRTKPQSAITEEGTRRTSAKKKGPDRFEASRVKQIIAGQRNEAISDYTSMRKLSDDEAVKYVQRYIKERGIEVSDNNVANFGLRQEIKFFKKHKQLKPWKEALTKMIQQYGESTEPIAQVVEPPVPEKKVRGQYKPRKKGARHAYYGRSVDTGIQTLLNSFQPRDITPALISKQLRAFGVAITPEQIIANSPDMDWMKKFNSLTEDSEESKVRELQGEFQKKFAKFIKEKSSGGVSIQAEKKQDIPVIPRELQVSSEQVKHANKQIFPRYDEMVDDESWNEKELHPKDFPEEYIKYGIVIPQEVANNRELLRIATRFNAEWEDPSHKKTYSLFRSKMSKYVREYGQLAKKYALPKEVPQPKEIPQPKRPTKRSRPGLSDSSDPDVHQHAMIGAIPVVDLSDDVKPEPEPRGVGRPARVPGGYSPGLPGFVHDHIAEMQKKKQIASAQEDARIAMYRAKQIQKQMGESEAQKTVRMAKEVLRKPGLHAIDITDDSRPPQMGTIIPKRVEDFENLDADTIPGLMKIRARQEKFRDSQPHFARGRIQKAIDKTVSKLAGLIQKQKEEAKQKEPDDPFAAIAMEDDEERPEDVDVAQIVDSIVLMTYSHAGIHRGVAGWERIPKMRKHLDFAKADPKMLARLAPIPFE